MTPPPEKPENKKLSPMQTIVWRVLALVAMAGVYFVLSQDHDIRQPFVAGVFVVVSVAIAFFARMYVRDNTDSKGRRLKKK